MQKLPKQKKVGKKAVAVSQELVRSDESLIEKTYKLLEANQTLLERLMERPAMNGGFDALVQKIDAIHEDLRNHIVEDDRRADMLLMPDDGLFARVKAIESLVLGAIAVKDDVIKLKLWHDLEEKSSHKEEELDEVQHTKLGEHDIEIKSLIETRAIVFAAGKWFLIAVGGGVLALIGRIIIGLINGHVKFM